MINRSLIGWVRLTLVILGCLEDARSAGALQYQPVDLVYNSGEECALILDGPGRSSAFDYTYNLLRGSFPPSAGGQTCITYDAVNHAYIEARKRIDVAQPKTENWRGEDLATVGELLLDISVNLAQKYGLTYDEIEKGLPLIDTSKTLIREVCPAYLSNVECRPGKYRRYDGLCTNLENPTWGATMTPFSRLLPPRYSDGINSPRISITGNDLPLARVVSRTMHPDEGYHDHAGTVMVIAWGQFMDHDYTLTATPLDAYNRNDPEECCNRPPHQKNPYCNEILIPEDDYFYKLFNVKCMDFVRGFPAPRPGCRLGSRVQFNLLTGVLDGNTVYGVSETFARKLRTGYGGLLRMNPVFSEYGLKDLLPLKLDIPDEGCTRPNRSMFCFEAGEIRVNEQLVLTCMHTLLAREHNRAAEALAQVNPHWDDETIFQEARRIIIAEIQHVTYNEFLPILLGKDVMQKFGLLLEKEGYWDGYDPTVNPGVIDAFAAAAYRFGHSLLPTAVERWSKAHKFIASKRLSDLIRRPYDLYRAGVFDEYFMGLMNQVAQAMDDSITQEVTNHLFKKVGAKFGMDLVSFNMQRGREFGIPSYMEFRKFCGLPGADTFEELFGSMPNETISRYSSIFEHPADVDLWSGGVSERPLPGSMLGPTFACIIATQFSYSRRGDRFWYELPNQPSSFTPEQLAEIRKSRLARLICDNTDLIDTIQLYPMVLPDHEINPRVPCRSGVLPGIDFSKWAEYPAPEQAARYNDETKKSEEASRRKIEAVTSIFVGDKTRSSRPSRNSDISEAQLVVDLTRRRSMKRMQNSKKKSARNNAKRRFGQPLRSRQPKRATFSIRQSTTTFGRLPAIEASRNTGSSPGYLFERSELEISPVRNIFRENLFSLRTFFGGGISGPRNPAPRGDKASRMREKPWQEKSDPVSRLVDILTGKTDGIKRSLRRSKRDAETPDATAQVSRLHRDNRVAAANAEPKFKRKYTPIFRECNQTAASEISDLNADPPLATGNTAAFREIDYPRAMAKSLDVERERIESSKKSAETTPFSALINGTYINLQDHQKETQGGGPSKDPNGYPLDIAPYNPDVIPYVDVPDYTDQREDSLDEDDRRVAKERYVDADVIDPSASPRDERRFQRIIVRDDHVGDAEEDRKADDAEEDRRSDDAEEDRGDKSSLVDEDEARGDEKVEEIEDATLKDEVGEKPTGPKVEETPAVDFTPVHFDINEYRKPFNLEELFEEFGMSENGEREEGKKAASNKEERSNKKERSNRKESDKQQGSRNVPVHEPNQESKLVDDFPDFSSSYASPLTLQDGNEGKTATTRETSTAYYPDFDRIFGSATPKPFTGFFDSFKEEKKSDSEGDREKPVSYKDEDTYERLFTPEERKDPYKALDEYLSKVSDEQSDEEEKSNDEEKENIEDETDGERYAETSDEDQDESQQQKNREETPVFVEKELSEKTLGPAYKTLEKILERKDDVSRLDPEVAENARMKGVMPKTYKNHWSLEYESPKVSSKR